MKNISKIVLLALFTLTSFQAISQLSIGTRAGVNFAYIIFEDASGDEVFIPGLVIAVPFNIGIVKKFSIQPEFMYIQKGYGEKFFFFSTDVKRKLVVNQIDIPVFAKFSFVNTDEILAYLGGGPVIGYALNAKIKVEANGQKEIESVSFADLDYNRFEVGATFGLGVGVGVGFGHIIFDTRFMIGFTNLDSTGYSTVANNIGFAFTLGYMVPLTGGEE